MIQGWLFDHPFFYRPESVGVNGGNWDLSTANEVIDQDCYGLKAFHAQKPNATTFLDIGANIGVFAMFTRSCFPKARIVCCEPLGNNFIVLKANTANLNVECLNRAIIGSDEISVGFEGPGLITGRANDTNSGNGYVSRGNKTLVNAMSMSSLLEQFDHVDFLKLDCEGSEVEILESIMGKPAMLKLRYIAGEWHGPEDNLRRIQVALASTHDFAGWAMGDGLGLFRASIKREL